MSGGEQAGKSYSAAMDAFGRIIAPVMPRLFWCIAANFKAARPEMEYFHEAATKLDLVEPGSVSFPNGDAEWSLQLVTGLTVRTLTATDPAKIAGDAPDGILLVEAAQCSEITYRRARGRIAPKDGWLAINGTFEYQKPEGQWFVDLVNRWSAPNPAGGVAYSLPSWENTAVYAQGLRTPRLQALRAQMSEDEFQERFGGKPTKPRGLVFYTFDYARHVQPVQAPADAPLELWIDPASGQWSGASAYAALAVAVVGDTVLVLDEIYRYATTTPQVIEEARTRWWWPRVQRVVMDAAGKQTNASGESHATLWRTLTRLSVVADYVKLPEGNARVHGLLAPAEGPARLLFAPNCEKTIWEFGVGYRNPTDSSGNVVPGPPQDRHNHATAAVRYGVVFHFGPGGLAHPKRPPARVYRPPWRAAV